MHRKTLRRPALGFAIALLVAAFAPTARAADELSFEYKTDHYVVGTDISARFAEVVARHMEEIYKEYSRRFATYGEADGRFDVKVFGREKDYWKHVPAEVKGSTGCFVERDRLLAAHAEGRTPEEVLRTLYHEGLHQFVYQVVSPRCPVWLNEGMAEYFSEATWDSRSFAVGQVPTDRLHVVQQAVRDGNYVPFEDLFEMNTDRWIQNARTDAHAAQLTYSQSWSIVHFLVHGDNGAYSGSLNKFLKAIAEGADQDEALEESFGPNLSLRAFEQAWARHVMSLEPSPKFRCRDNMEAIMLLALHFYRDPREFEEVGDLRRALMNNRRTRWEITRPHGGTISSSDPDRVARLFRCPFDNDSHDVSYAVVHNPATGLPVLVCNHHPGVILKAYYQRAPSGMRIRVEEEVRDLLTPQFRNAIKAAID
ncbi:MAG: DUF1570 domain-containing protein [Candidatus Brocadiia bacterium]